MGPKRNLHSGTQFLYGYLYPLSSGISDVGGWRCYGYELNAAYRAIVFDRTLGTIWAAARSSHFILAARSTGHDAKWIVYPFYEQITHKYIPFT